MESCKRTTSTTTQYWTLSAKSEITDSRKEKCSRNYIGRNVKLGFYRFGLAWYLVEKPVPRKNSPVFSTLLNPLAVEPDRRGKGKRQRPAANGCSKIEFFFNCDDLQQSEFCLLDYLASLHPS